MKKKKKVEPKTTKKEVVLNIFDENAPDIQEVVLKTFSEYIKDNIGKITKEDKK